MPTRIGLREGRTRDYLLDRLASSTLREGRRFKKEAAVPSYLYHPDTGMQHLYRLDIGCYIDDQLVGGIEVFATHAVDTPKWAFLRTFGFDVIEIQVADDDVMPAFPDIVVARSTFSHGPTRSIIAEPFVRRSYHPQLVGYPPLADVQAWEQRTPPATLRDYDARLNAALSENLAFFRRI